LLGYALRNGTDPLLAGCNSILSDGDTGSGLAVKETGNNVASLLKSAGAKRQGAGVGGTVFVTRHSFLD
jgi:hypothetical protein